MEDNYKRIQVAATGLIGLVMCSAIAAETARFEYGVAPNSNYTGAHDTFLSERSAESTFNSSRTLEVDGAGSQAVSLLSWNIASIPTAAVVTRVQLGVTVSNPSVGEYLIYQVKNAWRVSEATWLRTRAERLWNRPGTRSNLDRGTQVLGRLRASSTGPHMVELNALGIAVVQSWVNESTPNYGFVVDSPGESDGLDFASSEAPVGRPWLEVTYSLGEVDNPTPEGTFIRFFDTSELASSDPSGLSFYPDSRTLALVDSEVAQTPYFANANGFELRLNGRKLSAFDTTGYSGEPTGVVYNTVTGTLFLSDDDVRRIFEVSAVDPSITIAQFPVPPASSGGHDPEGITHDPRTGNLFVASGISGNSPGDVIELTSHGDLVSSFTVPRGVRDPEGIHFDPRSGHLFVSTGGFDGASPEDDKIWVITTQGELVRTIPLGPINAQFGNRSSDNQAGGRIRPKGIVIAPSSNRSDAPTMQSLYVTDYGVDEENDGRVFELSVNQSPVVRTLALPSANIPQSASLHATITDDGRPYDGRLDIQWRYRSGPGHVTFDDAGNANTRASFTHPGLYLLSISASDGDITTTRDVWFEASD